MQKKVDTVQDLGVKNGELFMKSVLSINGLDKHVEVLELQGPFVINRQEQDRNKFKNMLHAQHLQYKGLLEMFKEKEIEEEEVCLKLRSEILEGCQVLDALKRQIWDKTGK